jgi:hypothetical protein
MSRTTLSGSTALMNETVYTPYMHGVVLRLVVVVGIIYEAAAEVMSLLVKLSTKIQNPTACSE